MTTLPDRVEAAGGPDRELDGAIWCAINNERAVLTSNLPYYTASLNAAMTLIPPECRLVVLMEALSRKAWFAKLAIHEPHKALPAVTAATPALTITAAALRARKD